MMTPNVCRRRFGIRDAKRLNRERERLIRETTRLVNRMKACLVRFGVSGLDPTLRKAADCVEKLITPEGVRLPPLILTEMLRDMARLRFLREQIRSRKPVSCAFARQAWRILAF